MKMTMHIDQKKVEEAMAEYGVKTKTAVIDLALRRLTEYSACFLSPEWNPLY